MRAPSHDTARIGGALLACLCLAACASGEKEPPGPPLPTHTVVFGGDVTLGRALNPDLFDEKRRLGMFGDVAPLLRGADLALVNAEGVIASGGEFFDKDKREPRPYMFRAHPLAIEPLVDAGIDVVAAGNNHSGDYGPLALREMLDRLSRAGIGYAGAGHDARDAATPFYRRLGDLVVAIVGVNLSNAPAAAAGKTTPGSYYFDGFQTDDNNEVIAERLGAKLVEARRHADVVLLSPHWGDNWSDAPEPETRDLAKRLIAAGYDGILGHSPHWLRGVELIDGKPVIYAAGNLAVDFGGGDRSHQAFLWQLEISRAGVLRLRGHPLALGRNTANRARGEKAKRLLDGFAALSKALGTAVRVEDGLAVIDCDPGAVLARAEQGEPPARVPPAAVRAAPSDTVIDALPPDAQPVEVRYADGVEIVGYRLLNTSLSAPKAGAIVALYLRKTAPAAADYTIRLEARRGGDGARPAANRNDHLPGDWILPVSLWPVGKVIRDWTLFRLTLEPEGKVQFLAGLRAPGGELAAPVASSVPLIDGGLIAIGEAAYAERSPRVFDFWRAYKREAAASGGALVPAAQQQ